MMAMFYADTNLHKFFHANIHKRREKNIPKSAIKKQKCFSGERD